MKLKKAVFFVYPHRKKKLIIFSTQILVLNQKHTHLPLGIEWSIELILKLFSFFFSLWNNNLILWLINRHITKQIITDLNNLQP